MWWTGQETWQESVPLRWILQYLSRMQGGKYQTEGCVWWRICIMWSICHGLPSLPSNHCLLIGYQWAGYLLPITPLSVTHNLHCQLQWWIPLLGLASKCNTRKAFLGQLIIPPTWVTECMREPLTHAQLVATCVLYIPAKFELWKWPRTHLTTVFMLMLTAIYLPSLKTRHPPGLWLSSSFLWEY